LGQLKISPVLSGKKEDKSGGKELRRIEKIEKQVHFLEAREGGESSTEGKGLSFGKEESSRQNREATRKRKIYKEGGFVPAKRDVQIPYPPESLKRGGGKLFGSWRKKEKTSEESSFFEKFLLGRDKEDFRKKVSHLKFLFESVLALEGNALEGKEGFMGRDPRCCSLKQARL